jgi:hypothetical protein
MFVELCKRRDKAKKRSLISSRFPLMEASLELITQKKPTPVMKEIYHSITGEELVDVPRKPKPIPVAKAPRAEPGRRSSRNISGAEEPNLLVALANIPRKRGMNQFVVEEAPTKKSRVSEVETAEEMEIEPKQELQEQQQRQEAGRRHRRGSTTAVIISQNMPTRRGSSNKKKEVIDILLEELDQMTPAIFDALHFDPIVPKAFPALVGEK